MAVRRWPGTFTRRAVAGAFVALTCAGQDEEALGTALFGEAERNGAIENAADGSLFIDGIEAAPAAIQARLARLLGDGEFARADDAQPAPEHRPRDRLDRKRPHGTHRERPVPPGSLLSAQRSHARRAAAEKAARRHSAAGHAFPDAQRATPEQERLGNQPEAFDRLLAYAFPGNVWELESLIERGVALATGTALTADLLPEALAHPRRQSGDSSPIKTLETLEREHILKASKHWRQPRAGRATARDRPCFTVAETAPLQRRT